MSVHPPPLLSPSEELNSSFKKWYRWHKLEMYCLAWGGGGMVKVLKTHWVKIGGEMGEEKNEKGAATGVQRTGLIK